MAMNSGIVVADTIYFDSHTETAGTVISEIVPGRRGTKPRLMKAVYTPGGTSHSLYVMRPWGQTTLSAAALAAGGMALGVALPALVWAWAIAPVFLMAALPLSVGGWGTREAAAVAALAPFGVAAPAAVGVGMVYGLYGLAQGALGALALGLPRGAPR